MQKHLKKLFFDRFKVEPANIVRLPQAGGDRIYSRIFHPDSDITVIGAHGTDIRENHSFINFSKIFLQEGILVPKIYSIDPSELYYLMEDLGDTPLLKVLHTHQGRIVSEIALKKLAQLQTISPEKWEKAAMFPRFGSRQAAWDLNYFKYNFLKPIGIDFNEEALEKDFDAIRHCIENWPETQSGFMYRDFQSRNIIVKNNLPYFIDYQGGRKGPTLYDAVSFLWQAKAKFSYEERLELLNIYAEEFARLRGIQKHEVIKPYPFIALFRTLQVLGAYGFRGLIQKRAHFIESIPHAIENLVELKKEDICEEYPEICRIIEGLAADERFKLPPHNEKLTVTVFSFSYKKGYPEDLSGNGGGFMFDCRAMHNPGRYEEYKLLTGRDRAVIEFLEKRGEVQRFLGSAHELTDSAVIRYIQRGFSSLQIGFGCTGGQHRSVYCAEKTAEHLKNEFPQIIVKLIHREQGIAQTFQNG